MQLDVTMLNRGTKDIINIDSEVIIPKEKYCNTDILELKYLKLYGNVVRNSSDIITLNAELSGITDILWQNIILEVPLKLTNVENFNEYQGDGWRLVDEDSIKNASNPFSELKDMLGEE